MPNMRSYWAPAAFVWLAITALLVMRAPDIWAGGFPGNDDMMRLQQVRDLLAGQGWFDVTQYRFETPEGGNMHWSRIPDIFMATIIILTRPFIGAANAEHLAMLIWPLMLLTGVMASLAISLRRLGASSIGAALGLLMFALSTSIYQFWPGRIDHHGLEVTLVLAGLASVLSPSLSRKSAIFLALMIALMISVAIESLPYAGALIAALGIFWIVRGNAERQRLIVFGGSIAGFAVLAFLLDAPGPRIAMRKVCDAYGTGHLIALVLGGGLLAGLGVFTHRLQTWQIRLGAGALAGIMTLAVVYVVSPNCFGSPYAALSDLVQTEWLSQVAEAHTAFKTWQEDPARIIMNFGFILAGLGTCLWAFRAAKPEDRANWGIVLLLLTLASLTTVWQNRGVLFAHIFAAIPVGWAIGELFSRYRETRGSPALLVFAAGILVLSPTSWKILSEKMFAASAEEQIETDPSGINCRLPDAYLTLADMPSARVFAPIDLGTSILVRTDHTIFSAPYHRNPQSVGYSVRLFMAPPEEARAMLEAVNADYLLYCRGLDQTLAYAEKAPKSLSANLERGVVPAWMQVIGEADTSATAVQLYRLDTATDQAEAKSTR
ncbi:MAG: hypothetical protein V3V03_08595 [Hyphomonadaceae bacterium]